MTETNKVANIFLYHLANVNKRKKVPFGSEIILFLVKTTESAKKLLITL